MPFLAKLENSGIQLRKIFETIYAKDRIEDGFFVVTEDRLTMQTMDDAHVAMCDLTIMKTIAKIWKCDAKYSIGVSFETLLKVLKVAPSNSICSLKYDPDNGDTLQVQYHVGDSKKLKSSFKIKLIPFDNEQFEIPADHLPVEKQTVESAEFSRNLASIAAFSDELVMKLCHSSIHFASTGDFADADMELSVKSSTVKDEVEERFSIPYLQWVTKAGGMFAEFTIGYKSPALCFEFMNDKMQLRFFLAAKVA